MPQLISPPASNPERRSISNAHVHILMCTYNGARHLQAQLDSFLAQGHDAWSLWVSDDNSDDTTREILVRFQTSHPARDIRIFKGPGQGHAANFLSLLAHPELPETTVALSDQDDVWLPHKLSQALSQIGARSQSDSGNNAPFAYCCRYLRVDARLAPLEPGPLPRHDPGFRNALVQNILSGNCMVLNPAALALIRRGMPGARQVPFHDWWIYQLLSGAETRMYIDPRPGVLYRQHDNNVLGAAQGFLASLARFKMIRNRDYAGWINQNLSALQAATPLLTPENRRLVAQTRTALDGPAGLRRLLALRRLGLYRQTRIGNFILYGMSLFRRL